MVKQSGAQHDKEVMLYHGTMKWRPTASVLIATAKADKLVVLENARIDEDKRKAKMAGASAALQGKKRKTGFLLAHVKGDELSVLQNALKGIRDGTKAENIETRYLYDEEILEKAIAQLIQDSLPKANRSGSS